MSIHAKAPTDSASMLEYLKTKTVRDEITGCLVWQGAVMRPDNIPQMRWGKGAKSARRVIYKLIHRLDLPDSLQIGVRKTCHCLCCDPDHLVPRTRSQALKGRTVKPATRAKIAATRRREFAKLTVEQVAEVRESGENLREAAQRLGVDHSMIGAIRRGEAWRDYSSPWMGLGARA